MAAAKINMRRRMTLVLVVTVLCIVAVVVKLFIIQFIQGSELQAKAEEYRTRDLVVSAARGTIYDANGNKLAVSITADSVAAYPAQVMPFSGEGSEAKNKESARNVANTLAQLLDMDADYIYEKITSSNSFVWVQRKVDFEVAAAIKAAELPGITIVAETQRYYPRTTLAAQLLGFAGIDNQGLEGLEVTLDKWLVGEDGRIVGSYDAADRPIEQTDFTYIPPVDGNDVYLTIDENIQYFCERELARLMASDYPAKKAGIIIMDPNTCAILAMAMSDPGDPNSFADYDSSVWRNWLVQDVYEPGSTFKTITLATALEEQVVSASSTFYDGGYISVANARIHCWSSVPHGQQNLAESVANSCNPAFVSIAQLIEQKSKGLFYSYIDKFGFGKTTGISISGESSGLLQAESSRGPVEIATTGIGQGIAVTPIQMITAISAVANGGTLLKPQLVAKIMDGDEVIYEMEPEVVNEVISAETAAYVRELLTAVVTQGSGMNAALNGYTVAGKTGTAQKAANGVYVDGRYVASFVGMVPADNPELVCLVIVDEPSGVYFGSQVAAPIFQAVMTDVVRYLGIEPDEEFVTNNNSNEVKLVQVPNLVNLDAESASGILTGYGLVTSTSGEGLLVTGQVPSAGSKINSGSTVMLQLGGSTTNQDGSTYVTVPNLYGKRLSASAQLLAAMGLTLSPQGSGAAYKQSPEAGSEVPSGSTITVYFDDETSVINMLE